uniref:ATP synthase F0 subunit 8 n=1 Tax=Cipangopaludina chinensis TaxID=527796 RepID=A0A222YUR1_CIPCH|nr:ATP synthase F0 subunit 8 [Cipangopaludina chinensis]ASR74870.1 ATP synthase F0 subunit 8 [Cipangopaludina chinensis]
MPQLSPLSWVFLFFLFFWVMVLMTAILIWWMKKFECNLNVGSGGDDYCNVVENKWGW